MIEQWFCCDCKLYVELDLHLRCSRCGSDAVACEKCLTLPETSSSMRRSRRPHDRI